mgnify:CR=1 FL=1
MAETANGVTIGDLTHDNMQIIIVKFVDSFLDGCLLAPV